MDAFTIVVQLSLSAAVSLHEQQPANEPIRELQQTLDGLGVSLRPQHPGEHDPTLARYFIVEGVAPGLEERVLDALRRLPIVEAAYSKAPEELP